MRGYPKLDQSLPSFIIHTSQLNMFTLFDYSLISQRTTWSGVYAAPLWPNSWLYPGKKKQQRNHARRSIWFIARHRSQNNITCGLTTVFLTIMRSHNSAGLRVTGRHRLKCERYIICLKVCRNIRNILLRTGARLSVQEMNFIPYSVALAINADSVHTKDILIIISINILS